MRKTTCSILVLSGALGLLALGCGSSKNHDVADAGSSGADAQVNPGDSGHASSPDAGPSSSASDAGSDAGGPSDCFSKPTTYIEIINACTDAEKIDKMPKLPLLLSDGGLPKLP